MFFQGQKAHLKENLIWEWEADRLPPLNGDGDDEEDGGGEGEVAGALQDREQEAEEVDLGLTFPSRRSHESYILKIELKDVDSQYVGMNLWAYIHTISHLMEKLDLYQTYFQTKMEREDENVRGQEHDVRDAQPWEQVVE